MNTYGNINLYCVSVLRAYSLEINFLHYSCGFWDFPKDDTKIIDFKYVFLGPCTPAETNKHGYKFVKQLNVMLISIYSLLFCSKYILFHLTFFSNQIYCLLFFVPSATILCQHTRLTC